ncbi:MAG: YgeY family selenium metabolism-linked hydrolase [Bacteroidota bacterium]
MNVNSPREDQIIHFASQLVQHQSYSGQEEAVIRLVEKKMLDLGFEEVKIDTMGNVIGRVGVGETTILFDSHLDTVEVNDGDEWDFDPFGGDVIDGKLFGRGSVDMKSAAAASIFAAIEAKEKGNLEGKTVYVSCTVFEEDCDGENLKHMLKEFELQPDYVIICEPSNNQIALGHKGKAQVVIQTEGISAHGSAPEKGKNAVYEMAEIITRVNELNKSLLPNSDGQKGTVVLSKISSQSASLNAVPTECEIYLDRRTVVGETDKAVKTEFDALVQGKNASWKIGNIHRKSWTGLEINYEPFHSPWKIDENHKLTKDCITAYKSTFNQETPKFMYWDFSTNAVATIPLGIPTIGFGPGDPGLAHMRNEAVETIQIVEAFQFYKELIKKI